MDEKNATIKKLAKNVKANPDDSFSKFALALEFLKQDKIQKAKLFFEDVYHNDPDYVGVYYHLGKLYEQVGKLDSALKIYQEGIQVAEKQQQKRTLHELKEARSVLQMEMEAL